MGKKKKQPSSITMARSGIKVHDELLDFHKKFGANNKKSKPAYYFFKVGKRFCKVDTDRVGPAVKQDTCSEEHIAAAIKDLKPSDNEFLMFRVFFPYDDNGTERQCDTVLFVYW